jgi:putative tRNA adenosine deaminase-associated protein
VRSAGITLGRNVSYFAAAVVRSAGQWSAAPVSLDDAADVEDVVDRLRDTDPDADVSLLFVEADDAYLAIVRLDEGEDVRVFGSDTAFADESRLGALLLGEADVPPMDLDAEEVATLPIHLAPSSDVVVSDGSDVVVGVDIDLKGDPTSPEPAGDPELLADLGVSPARLLELCTHEGMLPSDITAEVCMLIGCGDEIEELREA